MDPAVMDRRTQFIVGVAAAELPVRPMTIAGVNQSMEARILSRDGSGPGSRVVEIPPGWGADDPGHFTADVELFVMEGEVRAGSTVLSSHCYAFLAAGVDVEGLSSPGGHALLITGAPVRYDPPDTGAVIHAVIDQICALDLAWDTSRATDGVLVKHLASGAYGRPQTTLVAASQWSGDGWRTHGCAEEAYVISGGIAIAESMPDGVRVYDYGPAGYYFRPAHIGHGGPGTSVEGQALMLVRSHGERATTRHVVAPPWPDGLRS